MDKFDIKDSIEKAILKLIIKNDYINSDYSAKIIKSNEFSENQIATIAAEAKQQILEKYKYPLCLEYFKAFEEALPLTATFKNSSGIKNISRNNKQAKYLRELKIMSHDDRLYPSNNDYRFDVFSDKGMH